MMNPNNKLIAKLEQYNSNNKLIAKFIGLFQQKNQLDTWWKTYEIANYIEYQSTKDMLFHKSWNELMPVAQKILSKEFADECSFDLWLEIEPILMDNIIDGFRNPNINELYNAVVEFITWHGNKTNG